MSKSNYKAITKKQEKDHNKWVEKNIEPAREILKEALDKMKDLGIYVKPLIETGPFPGTYVCNLRILTMEFEQFDRIQNPDKWKELDEKEQKRREKEQAKKVKEAVKEVKDKSKKAKSKK